MFDNPVRRKVHVISEAENDWRRQYQSVESLAIYVWVGPYLLNSERYGQDIKKYH